MLSCGEPSGDLYAGALASAILAFLASPRRTSEATGAVIQDRFRLPGVAARYLALYEQAARA